MDLGKVGVITAEIINLLKLNVIVNTPIYIGASNMLHMQTAHPTDFQKYGKDIGKIITNPDYVGIASDGSLEYVKEYQQSNIYVKVAVRASKGGTFLSVLFTRVCKEFSVNISSSE